MNPIIESISNYLESTQFTALCLDTVLKGIVVLALAGVVCVLWRKASAATRHLIWFLAVASLPCLPLLHSSEQSWRKPVWTISSAASSGTQMAFALQLTPQNAAHAASNISGATKLSDEGKTTGVDSSVMARFSSHWLLAAWAVWFVGAAVALIRMALGQFCRRKFSGSAKLLKDPQWTELLQDACEKLDLRRTVTLVQSGKDVMPMTWGWWRPVVLVPAEASNWLEGRRRVVLLHELAHVKRLDYPTQVMAQAVCALFWFNPLVWMAARQMCVERESACDDLVLAGGCKASDYAGHLVEIAGTFRHVSQTAAIAMARSSQLEGRISAIVDGGRNRRLRAMAAVAILVMIGGVSACVSGNGTNSVAAMIGGRPLVTEAGGWTNWNNGQQIGSFYAVAATPREVVAVGIDGRIATRNNATGKWKIETFTGDPDFRGIAYANGQYVVVREAGSIMTSKDGLTWQMCESPTDKNLLGLSWAGNQFLAGGDRGTIISSPDGIHWTSRDSGCGINFYSFSYSGNRYVAVGNDGIRISSNSITWTAPTTEPHSIPFTACVWTGSEFLACGLGLDRQPTIYTSPDGDVWTLRDNTITASLRAAITINGSIYVGGDSVVARSDDGGTTWVNTFKSSGRNALFMGLASDGNNLFAAGFNHNVWALPVSVTTSSTSPIIQLRLVLDSPSDNTEIMTNTVKEHQEILFVDKTVLLDQASVRAAYVGKNSQGYQEVDVALNDNGQKQFAKITREHLHQRLGIIIDGKLWTAPVIQSEIDGGVFQITGSFSEDEARALAGRINEIARR